MTDKLMRKAQRLIDNNRIESEIIGIKTYFKVHPLTNSMTYNVVFNPRTNLWSCDCLYFSSYGSGKDCQHILACKKLLKT